METIAFNDGWVDSLTFKNVLEGVLDGTRTRAG